MAKRQQKIKGSRKRKNRAEAKPVYVCEICNIECLQSDNISHEDDESVQCGECYQWFHQVCVDYLGEDDWTCFSCTVHLHDE